MASNARQSQPSRISVSRPGKAMRSIRLNIRTRMLVLCFCVAAPLLAIGCFSLYKEYKTLRHEAERATLLQAATGVKALSSWIQSQLFALNSIATLVSTPDSKANLDQKLSTALASQPTWKALYWVDENGEIGASAVSPQKAGDLCRQLMADDMTANLFVDVKAGGKARFWSSQVQDREQQLYLIASAPVIVQDKGGPKSRGQVMTAIDPQAVLNLFNGVSEPRDKSSSVVAVIDESKRVIARTIENELWHGKDFSRAKTVQAAQAKLRGTFEAVGIADPTPRAYAFDHVPLTNWLLVVGLPTATIYGTAHDWLMIMVTLAVSAVSLSFIMAYLATSHFTKAIHTLVREAIALGKGDFSRRVDVQNSDELGLLGRAFNEMARTLQLDHEQKTMVKHITEAIRQSLDIEDILNTTVKELGVNLDASRCCLALIDTKETACIDDDELSFDYIWHNPQLAGTPIHNKKVVIGTNTVLRKIIDQGSTIWLDVLGDQDSDEIFNLSTIKSMVACPIKTQHGISGLILVHQCDRLRSWSMAELELIEAVSAQVSLAIEHGRLYTHARSLAEQEQMINRVVRSVRTSLDLDTILDTVTAELSQALGADRVHIAQPRAEGPLVVTHEHHRPHLNPLKGQSLYGTSLNFHPDAQARTLMIEGSNRVLGIDISSIKKTNSQGTDPETTLMATGQPAYCTLENLSVINQVANDQRCAGFREYINASSSQSLIAAPLLNETYLTGVLIVHSCDKQRRYTDQEIRLVSSVADQLAVAIAHAQLFAQVKHQAITDGLTGLYNHVYFKNRLAEELRTAERKSQPVSLIMIDLDKLKVINDTYGHPVGDAAIRQIAVILKTLLRSGDTAARYGGEEFGIILPETSLLEAALIADRLCSQIRNTPVPNLGKITASLGAACYPRQALSASDLIEKADRALYVAKNSGRDQVRIFEEDLQVAQSPTFKNVTRDSASPESEK